MWPRRCSSVRSPDAGSASGTERERAACGVGGRSYQEARSTMKDYLVPPWVRVRREEFGLLFYDTRDTKLTFVRSGSSLAAPSFTGPERKLGVQCESALRKRAVGRVLAKLEAKG